MGGWQKSVWDPIHSSATQTGLDNISQKGKNYKFSECIKFLTLNNPAFRLSFHSASFSVPIFYIWMPELVREKCAVPDLVWE